MREGQRDEKIERGRLNMGKRRMHIYIYREREGGRGNDRWIERVREIQIQLDRWTHRERLL